MFRGIINRKIRIILVGAMKKKFMIIIGILAVIFVIGTVATAILIRVVIPIVLILIVIKIIMDFIRRG